MEKYDVCVIGGGPSGYAAAMRAIDFGKKVLLVEKDKLGGAGLYNGALSSKTMWEHSMRYITTRDELGKGFDIPYADVIKNVKAAVFDRKFQITVHAKLLRNIATNPLFDYVKGTGKLISKNTVEVTKTNSTKIIQADNIVVATGSSPRKLDHIPIDENIIVTSDGIESWNEFPKSLVVLGAGVIGCEFATIFSNFGKTKVYLIDKADRILPFEDEDVADLVAKNLEKNGVVIHRNSSLVRMEIKNRQVEYELKYTDGRTEVINVEKALVSVGRVPNTKNIGLDQAGVKTDERGYVVDNDTETNVPGIYAVGDITAHIALVNVGEREGRHALVKMYGPKVKPINFANISTIMFLNPEVAAVGLNEQEANSKKIPIRVAKIDYSCIARAIAMRKTNGFFKIIVSDDDEMKILGMRAVGEHASSAIQTVSYLIHTNQGIRDLADMMHPHPSIIEGIQEALRMLLGKSIYKPSIFKDKLKCYRCVEGVCTPLSTL